MSLDQLIANESNNGFNDLDESTAFANSESFYLEFFFGSV